MNALDTAKYDAIRHITQACGKATDAEKVSMVRWVTNFTATFGDSGAAAAFRKAFVAEVLRLAGDRKDEAVDYLKSKSYEVPATDTKWTMQVTLDIDFTHDGNPDNEYMKFPPAVGLAQEHDTAFVEQIRSALVGKTNKHNGKCFEVRLFSTTGVKVIG